MGAWFSAFSAWLASWMSAEAGLWGLFASALLSATILPGSSELVMVAVITAHPNWAWSAFSFALVGNLMGCLLTFGMGRGAREGYERFQRVRVDDEGAQVRKLRRWGPPALVLSVLPLVGDALVLAAGWLRLPLWASLAWIALGKAMRYLIVIAGMKGLLAFV